MEEIEQLETDLEKKIDFNEAQDHDHEWAVDKDGDGKSKSGEHEHDVIAFSALPCTEDGHIHRLALPAQTELEEWTFIQPTLEVSNEAS